jgi:lipooligosaccharide transport system permease protein
VAPALLASSAMNGAIYETSNNFFYKLKYAKLVRRGHRHADVAAATSPGRDPWALLRGSLYVVGFLAVIAVLASAALG